MDIPKHLRKVDFPATKQEIVTAAKQDAADSDVMNVLNGLPDKTYSSIDDVGQQLKE